MYSYKQVADVIRTARKSKGWTQVQLAEACKMHIAFVTRLEGGSDKNVTLNTLVKLAEGMGLHFSINMSETPYEKRVYVKSTEEDQNERAAKARARRLMSQVITTTKDADKVLTGKWAGRYSTTRVVQPDGEVEVIFDFDMADEELLDAFLNGELTA